MGLIEQTIAKRELYLGKLFNIEQHKVMLPNGKEGIRDIVCHKGAVAIVAVKDNQLLLVKQYRKAIEQITVEIPAGMLNREHEDLLDAAKRELSEETKFEALHWHKIVTMAISPGYLTETITLFWAEDLTLSSNPLALDEDEFVDVLWLSRENIQSLIDNGSICDAKTLYAIQYWDLMKKGE